MMSGFDHKINRREFLKQTAAATAAVSLGMNMTPGRITAKGRASVNPEKRVIVIGIDGMDPRLSVAMMDQGKLPHFDGLRKHGGFRELGTSIPPQSPVAWANFINGAGPGSHGIFDFIHRNPEKQCAPFYSAAETLPGRGGWEVGDHKIPLEFWPFNHEQAKTLRVLQVIPERVDPRAAQSAARVADGHEGAFVFPCLFDAHSHDAHAERYAYRVSPVAEKRRRRVVHDRAFRLGAHNPRADPM